MKLIDARDKINDEEINEAAKIIKQGGLVLFPTETVYGIGANGLNETAVKKIFEAKGRATDNPLILHISNMDMLRNIAKDITELEYKLMEAFWPGPFTIVLKKQSVIPDIVTGGLDTVAVRMPSNKVANMLINYSACPIAAPSANISGKPSGTRIEDIYKELAAKMDYIIDGGKCEGGIESTVVRVENNSVKILRPGSITKEQIQLISDSVVLDKHIFSYVKEKGKVLSPGMKYRHYAPDKRCILVYSKNDEVLISNIKEMASKSETATIICCDENKDKYSGYNVLTYGSKYNMEQIARNIFAVLRRVDMLDTSIVYIEGIEKRGIGMAIMNRLIRACSHEYIEL